MGCIQFEYLDLRTAKSCGVTKRRKSRLTHGLRLFQKRIKSYSRRWQSTGPTGTSSEGRLVHGKAQMLCESDTIESSRNKKERHTLTRVPYLSCLYSSCWPYLALQPTYFPLFSRLSGQGSASSITQLRPIFLAVSKRQAAAIFLTVAGCLPRRSAYSTRLISNLLPPRCKR